MRDYPPPGSRVFGLQEWTAWLNRMAQSLFGMTAEEFEEEFVSGRLADSGAAQDLGSMIPIISKLRQRFGA